MGLPTFTRPKEGDVQMSPNLYVANCGPAVGLAFDVIRSAFSTYGAVKGVYLADESGTRVIVSYYEESSAKAALEALDRHPCPDLGGRSLHVQYLVHQPHCKVRAHDSVQVSLEASEMNIPGVYLMHDFLSAKEEETRNVNTKQRLVELPEFVSTILQRIASFKKLDDDVDVILDQLTVNEYPAGIGLSPHIDTHSAFEDSIFSLLLAGPCIMEFRKYSGGDVLPKQASNADVEVENADNNSTFVRKAIFLPPCSMLLFLWEARYAWHHYIPHHKVDVVKGSMIRRGSRRVSFTFRKVRNGACHCEYSQFCDSQR